MSTIRTLGTTTLYVDLASPPYNVVAGSEADAGPSYDTVEDPVRNQGLLNLGVAGLVAMDFAFDVEVKGSSWTEVLAAIAAIEAIIGHPTSLAERYSTVRAGEQVTYQEAFGDQVFPTVWNVKKGEVRERRSKRVVAYNYTFVNVKLHCEPEPVS